MAITKAKKIAVLTVVLAAAFAIYGAVLGKLRVLVLDSGGKPIPGVKITIQSTRVSTVVFKITTKKNGVAVQTGLQNHVFIVTLEKEGYQTAKQNVKIPAGLLQKEEVTMYTAKEALEQSIANDPRAQAVIAFNKAAGLINQRKYDEALELLEEAISLDDSIHQAHYYLGFIYFEKGKYQESLQSLLKVVELDEENAQAYRLLAAVCEKLGKKAEAEKYTQLAQEKGGKTPLDAYNEGIHAFNSGETDKAIAAFEQVLKLDEKYADAYYRLGLCYLNKNENDKAIGALKKYIQLNPRGEEVETAKAILDSLK
jgi:tetratricopeptide (TPR) repeat protein